MSLPFDPPLEPMLAKPTPEIPIGDGWTYEPKWDGFRAIAFRDGPSVYLQSRDRKPLNRYFPELDEPLLALAGPDARFVVDGEIVIARPDGGLDFDSLLMRIDPAESRVRMLAEASPASFSPSTAWPMATTISAAAPSPTAVRAWSVWPPIRPHRSTSRRRLPTRPLPAAGSTSSRVPGGRGDRQARGLGLCSGKRTMAKIKHVRTADCVVAGFRWHKNGPGTLIGSLCWASGTPRGSSSTSA